MKKSQIGFLFILPWLLGLIIFTVFPIIAALYISMTDWSIIGQETFIGFRNFGNIFSDPAFYKALLVTMRYAVLAIPLTIIMALLVALSVNNQYKGIGIFRTIFYMPSIVSGVAVAIVFKWILDPSYGALNSLLRIFGITGPNWLYDSAWVLPSYLIMAVWGASGGLYIYLAALKDIPKELYEAATIDGAGWRQKIRYVTLPMLTPILFYNLVIGLIGAFRKFTDAYVLGGAGEEGVFYMVYLYRQAFSFYKMGYATALAWILFVIIFVFSVLAIRTQKMWVYYEGGKG